MELGSSDVASRTRKARHDAGGHGIADDGDHHRHGLGGLLGRMCPRRAAGDQYVDLEFGQLRAHRRQTVVLTFRPPVLDHEVLAFLVAEGAKSFTESGMSRLLGRVDADEPDAMDLPGWLRRSGERRGERPSQRGQHEAAAVHAGMVRARGRLLMRQSVLGS
jgi:hypothetical protein